MISNRTNLQIITDNYRNTKENLKYVESSEPSSGFNSDETPISGSPLSDTLAFYPIENEMLTFSSREFYSPGNEPVSSFSENSFQLNISDLIEESIRKEQLLLKRKSQTKAGYRKLKIANLKAAAEFELSFLNTNNLQLNKKSQNESTDLINSKTETCEINEKYLEECLCASEKQRFVLKVKKSIMEKSRITIDFAEENIQFSFSDSFPIRIAVDLNYLTREQKLETSNPRFILFTILEGLQIWQCKNFLWKDPQVENECLLGYNFGSSFLFISQI